MDFFDTLTSVFLVCVFIKRGECILIWQYGKFDAPQMTMIKTITLSVAILSVIAITGCASKPQVGHVHHGSRYVQVPEYYTVRSGDTLSGIAARYGLNYLNIAELNGIAAPYRIYVNQSLRLKGTAARTTTTRPITHAEPIQRQTISLPKPVQPVVVPTPVQTQSVQTANSPLAASAATTTSLQWRRPSNGAVIEGFNLANNVKGIRYSGNVGDPVFAAANGQVVYAADGLKEYGNLVLIKHIDGYITAYAHNSKMLVKSGENVVAGQKIAEMGSSGTSRVMMEFQVRLNGKPINPVNILPN